MERNVAHGSKHRRERADELRVVRDAKELEYHTYVKCRNGRLFPKKDRGGLPSRMMDEASNACEKLQDANDLNVYDRDEGSERLRLQRMAMGELRKLMNHIELAERLDILGENEAAYWSGLAADVLFQAKAWHASDKRRHDSAVSKPPE